MTDRAVKVIRIPIPILALAALAILFGHDTLMAAGPHEAGTEHHDEHEVPTTDCHVIESARPAHPDQPEPPAAAQTPCAHPGVKDASEQRQTRWELPPRHSPSTLRAMLQVFLN